MSTLWHRVAGRLPKSFSRHHPPTYDEPFAVRRRRRGVVALTSVAGAGLLGASLAAAPGSRRFYVLTVTTAAVWGAGGIASGPLHLGWVEGRDDQPRRPLVTPVATGTAAFGFFYASALVARQIPFLDRALSRVLRFADEGATSAVVLTACLNGAAEEVFFRGALYAAVADRHPVAASTAAYAAATTATRNPALVVAAALMGGLFALQRRASGGIQAPLITHLTWSVLMLRFLPPLFRRRPA